VFIPKGLDETQRKMLVAEGGQTMERGREPRGGRQQEKKKTKMERLWGKRKGY